MFWFVEPLNPQRRFIPLQLDDTPSKAPGRNSGTLTGVLLEIAIRTGFKQPVAGILLMTDLRVCSQKGARNGNGENPDP